jgi:type VI secretion system secreted protein VgrG
MDRQITLEVAGKTLRGMDCRGEVELSRLFSFELTAVAEGEGAPSAADLVGQLGKLSLIDGRAEVLALTALVAEVEQRVDEVGMAHYRLALAPEAAKLGVGRDLRVFQEKSAVDIVKDVFDRAGFSAVRWSTTGSYATRAYCAQYRESDWSFVERLLAEEGIHFFYDFAADPTEIVLSDDSTAAEDMPGGRDIPFREEGGTMKMGDAVSAVRLRAERVSDKVSLRDYNFDTPKVDVEGSEGDGPLEVYDYHERVGTPAEAKTRAKLRLQALRARRVRVTGDSGSVRLRPGYGFAIDGHPAAAVAAPLLCLRASYTTAEGEGIAVSWEAIPIDTPFRSPRPHVTRSTGGPQSGVVVGSAGEEIHPDDTGRIRVQFYWDREGQRDDKASTWMRVGQFATGGSMVLPRIGWDVLCHHHEDDVDAPAVTTHLYDGQFPVPYPLPANKTRTSWQTATTPGGGSSNEIRFEDAAGSEEMFINASFDMNVVVANDQQEKTGVDYSHEIGANHDITVATRFDADIGSNQAMDVGGDESLTISATRGVAIGGSETANIGGSRTLTVTSGQKADLTGGRTATIGGTHTSVSAMGVNRTAIGSMSVTVSGSHIQAAGTGVGEMTAGAGAETVGGAKVWAGAAGCETSVKGAFAETVGGAYVITAGADAGETTTGPLAITVGGAFLANAPSIEIEASSKISIRAGGSSLTITSGKIEVKAPSIASPAGTIKKKGSTIKHN